ncbi:hypothetical protein [Arsenophonus endosymbiont of Aleurodicus dispersus]|uniref:hypothetical protein n=1 Tax=Arsenophonus endosymbiont of Aleurodicus dispersus TaxID=235559 RepID=UPI000EB22296
MSEIMILYFFDQDKWIKDSVSKKLMNLFQRLTFKNQLVTMKYGTLLGGKQLRPFLVYAIGYILNVTW